MELVVMPSMESGSKATDIGQNSLMLNIILRHKVQFKKILNIFLYNFSLREIYTVYCNSNIN